MARILNMIVVLLLIGAAVGVYRVKYEATRQAEKITKLRGDIREEQEAIALLRAEWSQLSRPDRIEALAVRHLALKPLSLDQLDRLDKLSEKPGPAPDPIGDMLTNDDVPTSSIPGASR